MLGSLDPVHSEEASVTRSSVPMHAMHMVSAYVSAAEGMPTVSHGHCREHTITYHASGKANVVRPAV